MCAGELTVCKAETFAGTDKTRVRAAEAFAGAAEPLVRNDGLLVFTDKSLALKEKQLSLHAWLLTREDGLCIHKDE